MNNGTEPLKGEGIMGRMRTAFNAAMAAIVAAFMVIMSIQAYKELFVRETEPPVKQRTGIINVWHVVKYKPYSGSVSTIMADAARKLEKKEYGVFYSVEGMTEEEYARRIERGEKPDVISFPAGLIDADGLSELDAGNYAEISGELLRAGSSEGKLYAIPYAQSPCVLIENNELSKKIGINLDEGSVDAAAIFAAVNGADGGMIKQSILSGRAERWALIGAEGECLDTAAFKEGKAVLCIDDVRTARELSMLSERGKGFNYTVHGITGQHGNAQLIAIPYTDDEWVKEHAERLIQLMLSPKYSLKIAQTGLYPSAPLEDQAESASPVDAREVLSGTPCVNAFLLNRYKDAIAEEAARALSGDSGANGAIVKRYGELFD